MNTPLKEIIASDAGAFEKFVRAASDSDLEALTEALVDAIGDDSIDQQARSQCSGVALEEQGRRLEQRAANQLRDDWAATGKSGAPEPRELQARASIIQ